MERRILNTDTAPKAIGPYSQGICAGGFLFISGQIGINPETGKLAEDAEAQVRQVMDNLSNICKAAETTLARAVRISFYLVDLAHFPIINNSMAQAFPDAPPTRSTIEVSALPLGALVEADAIVQL